MVNEVAFVKGDAQAVYPASFDIAQQSELCGARPRRFA